jgi:cytochrome c-type biogenesis protein CcmF
VIGVVVEPLVSWLWFGGMLMAVGTLLALVPGKGRNPTAPVSELVSAS